MDEKQYILDFFNAANKLKEAGIIRSDRYLGDIGEHICKKVYNINLNESLREEGYDGLLDRKKVEIKFHNSRTRTNICFGNPEKYDIILIVLGSDSLLNPIRDTKNEFLIYKFDSCYVKDKLKNKSGYSGGKNVFKNSEPDKRININIDE